MKYLDQLVSLLEQTDFLSEQASAAAELRQHATEEELIVSVIGQFKRGKSSTINALLDDKVLPVGIIPLTTVITELRWGSTFQAVVCYTDGTQVHIEREALAEYCSEQKNPGNHKQVQTVKIWSPKHPFGEGIVLVDTPGVGSVHQHNTNSSYAYLKKSDAILFLLSVDSPVSEIERDFLLNAQEYAAKFFFAVNKSDLVSPEDLETFLTFCKQVISDCLGTEVFLSAISAKTGEGISALVSAISRELHMSQQSLLKDSIQKKMDLIIGQAQAKTSLVLQASALPAETLDKKLNRIKTRREELLGFSDEIQTLARHRTKRLVDKISAAFAPMMEDLKQNTQKKSEELYQKYGSLSAKEFENLFQSALNDFLRDQLTALNQQGISLLNSGYDEIVSVLSEKAVGAAHFLAAILKEEFDLDYPVNESVFQVSDRSDFFLRLGSAGTLLLDVTAFDRFLPRRIANNRFLHRSLQQAQDDIQRNGTNMLYNYRYKMQESLRILCDDLERQIRSIVEELTTLIDQLQVMLTTADARHRSEVQSLSELLEDFSAIQNAEKNELEGDKMSL